MEREIIQYYRIKTDTKDFESIYSIDEIERILYERFMRSRLEKVYVELNGYLYSRTYDDNLIDLSYMGGDTLLVFDNGCLNLMFHGDGMFRCRILDRPLEVVECFEKVEEYVDCVDEYPFLSHNFNANKVHFYAEMEKLPSKICLQLKNGNVLFFQGDSIEYYYLGIDDDFAV